MRPLPQRIEQVQTPVIPVVGEWIAQHPGTISLGQGVVHYGPPPEVGEAVAAAAADAQVNRYGLVRGQDALLELAAAKVARENGIELSRGQVVFCTAGSNMGFLNATLAIADVGDEIILLSPFYFNHEMAVQLAGCRPVIAPTDDQYKIDLSAIERAIGPRTRAVVTVSPNNPTGAVQSEADLAAVNRLCRQRGLYHISDEAYEYFTYDGDRHFSPASLADAARHTISLYSLSKSYGMAGWRTGYMVMPQELEVAVKKIQDTNLICPPIICQVAAAAALKVDAEWRTRRIAAFAQVRDQVMEQLTELGERCQAPRPSGAFYALLRLDTDRNDLDLIQELIKRFGVAAMPGSAFGVSTGCTLRIAYGALDRKTTAEGMGRLVAGLQALL